MWAISSISPFSLFFFEKKKKKRKEYDYESFFDT